MSSEFILLSGRDCVLYAYRPKRTDSIRELHRWQEERYGLKMKRKDEEPNNREDRMINSFEGLKLSQDPSKVRQGQTLEEMRERAERQKTDPDFVKGIVRDGGGVPPAAIRGTGALRVDAVAGTDIALGQEAVRMESMADAPRAIESPLPGVTQAPRRELRSDKDRPQSWVRRNALKLAAGGVAATILAYLGVKGSQNSQGASEQPQGTPSGDNSGIPGDNPWARVNAGAAAKLEQENRIAPTATSAPTVEASATPDIMKEVRNIPVKVGVSPDFKDLPAGFRFGTADRLIVASPFDSVVENGSDDLRYLTLLSIVWADEKSQDFPVYEPQELFKKIGDIVGSGRLVNGVSPVEGLNLVLQSDSVRNNGQYERTTSENPINRNPFYLYKTEIDNKGLKLDLALNSMDLGPNKAGDASFHANKALIEALVLYMQPELKGKPNDISRVAERVMESLKSTLLVELAGAGNVHNSWPLVAGQ